MCVCVYIYIYMFRRMKKDRKYLLYLTTFFYRRKKRVADTVNKICNVYKEDILSDGTVVLNNL